MNGGWEVGGGGMRGKEGEAGGLPMSYSFLIGKCTYITPPPSCRGPFTEN